MKIVVWRFLSPTFGYFNKFDTSSWVNIKHFFALFYADKICSGDLVPSEAKTAISLLESSLDSATSDDYNLNNDLYMRESAIDTSLNKKSSNNLLSPIILSIYHKYRKYIVFTYSCRYESSFCCRLAPY